MSEDAMSSANFANEWEAEEDRICECGAAGSGELHLDWCEAKKFNTYLMGEPPAHLRDDRRSVHDREPGRPARKLVA
jgi:hypothetical protein